MVQTMAAAAVRLFPSIPQYKLVEGGIGDNWKMAKGG